MTMIHQLAKPTIFLCLWMHCSCAVDVGNPNPDGETAKARMSVATEQNTIGQSFSLSLEGIEIRGTTGGVDGQEEQTAEETEVSATIEPSVETVQLYSDGSSEETVTISELVDVPVGTYHEIVLTLNVERPFHFFDSEGEEREVRFEDQQTRSIVLAQSFSIDPEGDNEIIIAFDLRRSIIDSDQDHFLFKPRGSVGHKKRGLRYEESVDDDSQWVCAYLYDPVKPEHMIGGAPPRRRSDRRPPKPFGVEASDRPFFESEEDLIKDEDNECEHAFERVPVIDGLYSFRHLRPGTYDFRAFAEDGSFNDLETGVRLIPDFLRERGVEFR